MENKNSLQISNRMSLIETIKKSLDEDLIASAAREGKLVASELEAYLKIMIKDQKIAAELTKNGIRTAEELLAALKGNRLTKTLKGSLELSVLRSNTKNAKLIDLATENLVRNKKFDEAFAVEFAKGQPAYEKALKQAGYSEDAITKIVQKKFNQIDPKTGKPYARPETIAKKDIGATSGKPKPNVPPAPSNIKSLWEKWKGKIQEQLKKKPSWKQLVAWAAGLGIGSAALWFMMDGFAAGEKPADTPTTPPADDTAWAPCIKELLDSKEGRIAQVGSSKLTVVVVQTPEYPEGLNFVSNGRVADVKTKKMGSWKCKDGQVKIQAESKIMSLTKLVLNEQANEISDETMDSYVDTAVDDLDGYVGESNLKSLKDILTALKGKTYQGEDAIKKFLEFYKQDEGVDFETDVNSVGVANLSVMAKNMKPQIIALSKNLSTSQNVTPPAGKTGLSKIDITWDGEKKGEAQIGGADAARKKSGINYHDCSSKDVFEFGCISPKLAEIQGCLGITPQKGYFGPKTKRTLEGLGYDLSKGITLDMYNDIKTNKCGKVADEPARKKYSDAELSPITAQKIKLPDTATKLGDLTGKIKPIDMGGTSNNGESLYKMLQSNYGDGSKPEFPYIFSEGGRLKYKGEFMGGNAKDQLSQYVATLGYREEPIKDKDKSYGVKYVWVKE
jgi:hypothetical protein